MIRRQGIMLCYPFEEKRLRNWRFPVIVQPKLDGIRCRAVPVQNGWQLLSSEGKEIHSCPHILSELNNIPEYLRMELDGELYKHDAAFEQITGITSRTANLHINHSNIEYHIFDVVSDLAQTERVNLLTYLFRKLSNYYLRMVNINTCSTLERIVKLQEEYVAAGYEGVIIRNSYAPYERKRSTKIMKFKPFRTDWYEIIGWKEEVDKHNQPKGRLGALICKGDDGTEFSVGSGLTDQQRRDLWLEGHSLCGNYTKVKYQHLTKGKGAPRFPVFIEIDDNSCENFTQVEE